MRIDSKTPFWVVIDPSPHSTLPDGCFETDFASLRVLFEGEAG